MNPDLNPVLKTMNLDFNILNPNLDVLYIVLSCSKTKLMLKETFFVFLSRPEYRSVTNLKT